LSWFLQNPGPQINSAESCTRIPAFAEATAVKARTCPQYKSCTPAEAGQAIHIAGPLALICAAIWASDGHFISLQDRFATMTTLELKTLLIHRISEINDISFLRAIKTILDTKTESGVIQLTQDQLDDIIESKKEIEKGMFVENSVLDKQVHQWLSVK